MIREEKDYSLARLNTFGMEAKTAWFVEYDSAEDLCRFLQDKERIHLPLLAVGEGSNLLFTKDYPGTVLHSAIKGYTIISDTDTDIEVKVGAGEKWDDFVAHAIAHGWYGAENLSLIPGEVGASAVQNIGAYGVEAKDLIASVEAVGVETGERRCFANAECHYAYRRSIFKEELRGKYIVTYVTYHLHKQPILHLDYGNIRAELAKEQCDVTPAAVRQCVIRIRQEKLPDPAVTGNAGSFFMNPIVPRTQYEALLKHYPDIPHYAIDESHVKIPAGWMIDRCGWKGRALGRAGVHDKQALVLVNRGGATADEIVRLSEAVIRSVDEKFGITLHPEVNFI